MLTGRVRWFEEVEGITLGFIYRLTRASSPGCCSLGYLKSV